MGHPTQDIRHRTWDIGNLTSDIDIGHLASDIWHQTSDIGGLNFCPRFFGGFVWSPRDFFGFLYLPPFDHPCLLKSDVPPPPPPQPPTSEYGTPLRITFETSIVSLNDFKRERKLPHFNIISDRFQYQDSMYKIFNKTFFVHDVGFDVQLIQPLSFDVYIFLKEISKQATLT